MKVQIQLEKLVAGTLDRFGVRAAICRNPYACARPRLLVHGTVHFPGHDLLRLTQRQIGILGRGIDLLTNTGTVPIITGPPRI
ncbi:MAG TPA: hypothetical protein VEX68_03070 [Bryobacteraceae bacterium]|nr:hypothetical protein [Bryobacteraceae bacterium]